MSSFIDESPPRLYAPPADAALLGRAARLRGMGLAGRLLVLTIGSVLLVLTLFYSTRLSISRENWLRDRIVAARTATLVFGADQDGSLPRDLTTKILDTVGAKMISIETPGHKLLLSSSSTPPTPDYVFDVADASLIEGVGAAFQTLFAPRGSVLQASGLRPMDGARIEITLQREGRQYLVRC